VRISLDGRGRGFDTMCGERRWRRVKSEEVDRKADRRVPDARHGWQGDFACYTRARIQPSLHYQPPAAVYRQGPKRAAVTTVNCRVIGLDSGEYFILASMSAATRDHTRDPRGGPCVGSGDVDGDTTGVCLHRRS
jgi:hypothetical protein